tara:strand:+ start:16772 stop:16987 length:216 start_codon:yes stop_codon:yes gene_type:complete
MNIIDMIDKAMGNEDTPDYAHKILKSIRKQVQRGVPPTTKQYGVIFANWKTKEERAEVREMFSKRRKRRYR